MKGIWKYDRWLPNIRKDARVTLGEGGTPLVESKSIGRELGLDKLYFKLEICNPSGSYKDRFASMAISSLKDEDISNCFATSSGNTGAALAAYSAAAGIKCFVLVVDGAPLGKLEQMLCYGATILMVKGFGKDLEITNSLMREYTKLASELGGSVQISAYRYSPVGMQGVQTIAYEIADEIQGPDLHVFCPAGGGGLAYAVALGFREYNNEKVGFSMPRLHCVQPIGNDTLATALRTGRPIAENLNKSTTSISGLQVPNVLDGNELITISRESGGSGFIVKDEAVFYAQRLLSTREGIFSEPAGAVSLAGLIEAVRNGDLRKGDNAVCVVTGSGFKDPSAMTNLASNGNYNYFNTINETFDFIQSNV